VVGRQKGKPCLATALVFSFVFLMLRIRIRKETFLFSKYR
jgi:hypothetical protein